MALIIWFAEKRDPKKPDLFGSVTITITGVCLLIPTWINFPGSAVLRYNQLLIFPAIFAMIWGIRVILSEFQSKIESRNRTRVFL